ncbi:MAG: NAD-dependent succinate-semialdehyde dehydrogenase [Gammaproteobacteria bacterium]|nr:NAD-dependent succinate-semialdehyde dehydrogenase [Gammaproteobacteria bacterium]
MAIETRNPVTGELLKEFRSWNSTELDSVLNDVAQATPLWQKTTLDQRAQHLRAAASLLRKNQEQYAQLITMEMGKVIAEARAEVEKCATGCDYYADNAAEFLKDDMIESDAGRSYVACLPLGTILAIMPWNFPFWQVFRFAAPGLMAGNTVVLKHASNTPQCALAIEQLFLQAGLLKNVFRTLLISAEQTRSVIEDRRIHAVTLTGSETAGRRVASVAGACIKKTVLELGGSDAFVVLEDADLDEAAKVAVKSRFLNSGQSCIAAKRIILVEAIADAFVERFVKLVRALKPGNPLDSDHHIGPLARHDLRDTLHEQVRDSITQGATPVLGCKVIDGPGTFYEISILDNVLPGMRAYDEELFGPVACIVRVKNEQEALQMANLHKYGLGASVWTRDVARGERFARDMQSGASFVNGLVKSDARLPFGGIKGSGYGRELSRHGIHEFVNLKTIWIK